ncbi:hypothetical protein [Pelagibacterium halotolerans]|uniref:hypothetical protein n=1 Tax=Pelagibacterium halotolerans TaxID=531813 RepID=UPI00384AE772
MLLPVPRTTAICRALIVFLTTAFLAQPAFAYVGPGAGLTAIGTMVAVLAALILALVGFIWYPLKRLMRRKRPADQIDGSK